MKDYRSNIPDPEEAWPAAEAILDGHFRRKKRRRYGFLLLLLLLITTAGWLLTDHTTGVPGSITDRKESVRTSVIKQAAYNSPERVVLETGIRQQISGQDEYDGQEVEASREIQSVIRQDVRPSRSAIKREENPSSDNSGKTTAIPVTNRQGEGISGQTIVSSSNIMKPFITDMEYRQIKISDSLIILEDIPLTKIKEENRRQALSSRATTLLHVYGGMAQVSHIVSHPGNSPYANRREKEEGPAMLPSAGLQWVREGRNWGTRLGAELAVMGEKTGYSPYLYGDYTTTTGVWTPANYSVTDTDSAYIYGMLFYNIFNRNVTDSVYTLVTDTLQGMLYEQSVQEGNGINRKYILQFPVEVSCRLAGGRLTFDAILGVTPGINVMSRGRYLTRDERGIYRYEKGNSKQFTLGAGAGLECGYLLNERFRLALRAQYRMQLMPYREENGADLIYRTVGLQGGVMYRLR